MELECRAESRQQGKMIAGMLASAVNLEKRSEIQQRYQAVFVIVVEATGSEISLNYG